MVYVTHDQEEALVLSDRIAVMNKGEIIQLGTTLEVYLRPNSSFVADFVGLSTLLSAKVVSVEAEMANVETELGEMRVHWPGTSVGDLLSIIVRPEHAKMAKGGNASGQELNTFEGTVTSVAFGGKFLDCFVEVGKSNLRVQVPSYSLFQVGDPVHVTLPPERCIVLPLGATTLEA